MMIGFLLPLLRRLSPRTLMLTGILAMMAGLGLIVTLAMRGHTPGGSVLLIRIGILLVVAGPVTFTSGVRGARRGHHIDRSANADGSTEQPGDET